MEENINLKKLNELKQLMDKKQYQIVEKKSYELFKQLELQKFEQYNFYIDSLIIYSEALSKNVKNLKALEELENVLKLFPYDEKILLKVYDLCLKMKRNQRAEEILNSIIIIFPEKINYRMELINIYLEKNDFISVMFHLNTIFSLDLNNEDLNRLFLFCLKNEKLFYLQLSILSKSTFLNPENISLISNEVDVYIELNKTDYAIEILNKLFEYLLGENKTEEMFLLILQKYIDLYRKNAQFDYLVDIIIKFLVNDSFKISSDKFKNEVFSFIKSNNLDFIFNFLCRNSISHPYKEQDKKIIFENIIFLINKKELWEQNNFNLNQYLNKNNIENNILGEFFPFIKSLVLFERQ